MYFQVKLYNRFQLYLSAESRILIRKLTLLKNKLFKLQILKDQQKSSDLIDQSRGCLYLQIRTVVDI